jgi:hypothetical protein
MGGGRNVLGALGRDVPCAHELHVQGVFGMNVQGVFGTNVQGVFGTNVQGVFGTNVQGVIWCLHMNDIRECAWNDHFS